MVSVQRVYNTLKNLANKDQKGFITPSVFNSFAHIAQLNVFNEIMGELVEARKMNRAGVDAGSVLSMRDRKIEDMSYYLKKAVFSANSERKRPSDLYKISYITSEGSSNFQLENYDTPYGRCEIIYNPRLFEQLKISRLSGFSNDYRIALIGREKIEVWPNDDYSELFMYYYCVPGSFSYNTNSNNPYTSQNLPPSYAVNMLDGVEIFDVFNSRNFHLPPSYESELVSEMASMIGLNLRDTEIQAYSQENTVAE
jgi:hypothetical protein